MTTTTTSRIAKDTFEVLLDGASIGMALRRAPGHWRGSVRREHAGYALVSLHKQFGTKEEAAEAVARAYAADE